MLALVDLLCANVIISSAVMMVGMFAKGFIRRIDGVHPWDYYSINQAEERDREIFCSE